MDLASVLVVLAMLVLAAAFVSRPLTRDEGRPVDEAERRLSALYAEHDQILSLLYELDADYAMGKILPEDHRRQRAERMVRGSEVLREIDSLGGKQAGAASVEADLEAQLEREVGRIRQTLGSAVGYCGQCGHALTAGDRFCARCGTPAPVAGAQA
jgi:hypothetical protein